MERERYQTSVDEEAVGYFFVSKGNENYEQKSYRREEGE